MFQHVLNNTSHRTSPLPTGPWVMTQRWDHLLFMHWPVTPEIIKKHVPEGMTVDTFDRNAWITIIPFKIGDMRFRKLPPFPFLKSMLEVNVRTYVRRNGVPGIYFFSLEASKLPAVIGARAATLPYYHADMHMKSITDTFYYESKRKGSQAALSLSYRPVSAPFFPEENTLDEWLLERYWLWTNRNGTIYSDGIHHKKWEVYHAEASIEVMSLASFLPENIFERPPLLHYALTKRVLFWPIRKE
ncbi:YqjF family protein [Alteribacillus iranensis]|uniref:DUF2071 domain-containing protein n=1 Tax=Alteribacillus iranensis TaxID=930128 RepID=A0A1I2EAL3_9BACI|nr:DUF2071 domain-containing protein [Alteribacillus iranensis]SFE89895.1 hypothetical protein SAMN05192532_105232 [Alteribacillus iranensis]